MSDINITPYITVEDFFSDNEKRLKLSVVNSDVSFNRKIKERELHRPGLALSGFVEVFTYWRIQIMGNTEIGFLNTLHGLERVHAISTVLGFDMPCIIITGNNTPPQELVDIANNNAITIFSTPFGTTRLFHMLSEYLDAIFAPSLRAHGSLIDVFSVGLLITGSSAIGKSELTLDLVERGHQLVADDVVNITKIGSNTLEGEPSEVLKHHMEIRGLGIIDVKRMFGIRGVRGKKKIDVVVYLDLFSEEKEYERIGVDDKTIKILSVNLPLIEIPIFPGKNITVIAEAIAMNHQLRMQGEHPAKEFNEQLIKSMESNL